MRIYSSEEKVLREEVRYFRQRERYDQKHRNMSESGPSGEGASTLRNRMERCVGQGLKGLICVVSQKNLEQ